ncbi:MAG: DNA mismatch repair protein MutL [Alphaproteobacteria bacterium RIFCSPLOWO2_01_FULL_45_8]|nr:MAG: DNA mismatch repair protein MutL [Alphaproteobacteria bacterium GWB1_45_5]OFW76327.1 MAG: DNA mismatch repair protein MutL [Alphaproteobacteria bacterium GWA1_45_9]OFW89401.1 MAG: DNA mismatch repair protein MutL [Alphaproteobacteria bacterium RIFCSPHIGHO2_01_FULL_41_14]OFW95861.1 MAG: DNA mismatch repair protein MutL [Alphaproteobacteria bacterium RIFCSPLOWO2_01_FULL_45_8]HCI48708.1 DNA mismatch repair endonuclease MutL [Holosporales bacterium]
MATTIQRLSSNLINQIAAGEVIERPASVVKELTENAIDAGATQIDVVLRDGGKSYISVTDNGSGMGLEDLRLSIERHATSKLLHQDLFNIATLGFRGEALPSIGAISRLTLTSMTAETNQGWSLSVEGGTIQECTPVAAHLGTKIEVRDLFFAVPARLKFLKTTPVETQHIEDRLQRLALAYPDRSFSLMADQKLIFSYAAQQKSQEGLLARISQVMGHKFENDALAVDAHRDHYLLSGFIGLPTLNRTNTQFQFLFVNGRPVKDKLFSVSIRAAYQDFLAHDRHPLLCLYLTVPSRSVDVNVHPAKTEVRFEDTQFVRSFLISTLKQALSGMQHRSATSVADDALSSFRPKEVFQQPLLGSSSPSSYGPSFFQPMKKQTMAFTSYQPVSSSIMESVAVMDAPSVDPTHFPLGAACAQLHENYIVAQTQDGLVIVDQHAAHERIVYEKLKQDMSQNQVKRQILLIPEVVELTKKEYEALIKNQEDLVQFGIVLESFGTNSVLIREVPTLLGQTDIRPLIKDLSEDLASEGEGMTVQKKFHEICSSLACHGSVRSGRQLSLSEMNDLLRQMEQTPYSGQCNHGRPTQIELKLKDIEKLFGRR